MPRSELPALEGCGLFLRRRRSPFVPSSPACSVQAQSLSSRYVPPAFGGKAGSFELERRTGLHTSRACPLLSSVLAQSRDLRDDLSFPRSGPRGGVCGAG